MPTFADARALAETMLSDHLPDRWQRAQSLARAAIGLADLVDVDRDALIRSAVLLDVGYSPVARRVGFAPVDGARFLTVRGYAPRVVALVAHQSAAAVEAGLLGVGGLEGLPDEASPTRDALWFCDAITGPAGERVDHHQHWAEIRHRDGPDGVGRRYVDLAEPMLRAAVERTRARMDAAGIARPA